MTFTTVPAVQRFWGFVERRGDTECWSWRASHSPGGYGRFSLDGTTRVQAHRFAFELLVGPIPEGKYLDHVCRNRGCVNPWHLEPVTNGENVLRGVGATAVNARKERCPRGHLYTHSRNGSRRCHECDRLANVAYRARRGAEVNARKRERRALVARLSSAKDPA